MKISIVYITNGRKSEILNKCLISAADVADEIIVVGDTTAVTANVIKINETELANSGMISKMRNIGSMAATGDIIINADDDIFFPFNFKQNLHKYLKRTVNFESATTRVIGINGSRYWDRAVHNDQGHSYMIDYNETNPGLYYSGAFVIRSRDFAEKNKWDDNLKYYEKEDVDFSNRIKKQGYTINIDVNNYVVHLDDSYISYRDPAGYLVCDKNVNFVNEVCHKTLREINALMSHSKFGDIK